MKALRSHGLGGPFGGLDMINLFGYGASVYHLFRGFPVLVMDFRAWCMLFYITTLAAADAHVGGEKHSIYLLYLYAGVRLGVLGLCEMQGRRRLLICPREHRSKAELCYTGRSSTCGSLGKGLIEAVQD